MCRKPAAVAGFVFATLGPRGGRGVLATLSLPMTLNLSGRHGRVVLKILRNANAPVGVLTSFVLTVRIQALLK
jgi:hypothetical protein